MRRLFLAEAAGRLQRRAGAELIIFRARTSPCRNAVQRPRASADARHPFKHVREEAMIDQTRIAPTTGAAGWDASRRRFLTGVVTTASIGGLASSALAQGAPNLRFINPPAIAKPSGYSHVVEVTGPGRTVYIAGQLGYDVNGKAAGQPGDFRAQASQAFENLKAALAAVGGDFRHVVKLNTYLTDIAAQIPILREVRDGLIRKDSPPASTTIQISRLAREGALIEVEAVAVLPA
jgi:enamine deaminase RidA (YjgF/YER057c/UK114 family)